MDKFFIHVIFILFIAAFSCSKNQNKISGEYNRTMNLKSPDKKISVDLFFYGNKKFSIKYSIGYMEKNVLLPSGIDLSIDNSMYEQALALDVPMVTNWFDDLEITGVVDSSVNNVWNPLYGERDKIENHYNLKVIKMEKKGFPSYKLNLEFRAYNEGIAFRYCFPENPKGVYYHIVSENTEFVLPAGTRAWHTSWAQGGYKQLALESMDKASEGPLSLELENGLKVCLFEANVSNYPKTKFKLSPRKKNAICTSLFGNVSRVSPFETPWRGILIDEEYGKLLEHNYVLQNLCNPSQLKDNSWIKPGKIIREMTLTTEGAISCIDFAKKYNLQYILFDSKWYGPSMTFDSDAGKVVAPIDMKKVVEYGNSNGIGVWLYVNQQALQTQADVIFPLYQNWGIKGVKFGFVQFGSHRWTVWLDELIKKAADNHLMVNIHDEYRPTGTERTWPNVLTQEGIRGNEEMPDATHNTILPFTRMIAGAADYTVCYYSNRIKTTRAHQLALSVIMYSPLQTLFWYDKPSDSRDEPELEFFKNLPTVWDETKVLGGGPGEFVSIARKKGDDWFIGAITNNEKRELPLLLDFLDSDKIYVAKIYTDNENVRTLTKVKIDKAPVKNTTRLNLELKSSGGCAIWIKQLNERI